MLSAIKNLRISTKIMLAHAAALVVLLLITSSLTMAGLSYTYFHQAEREVGISEKNLLARLDENGAHEKGEKRRHRSGRVQKHGVPLQNGESDELDETLGKIFIERVIIPGVLVKVSDLTTGKTYTNVDSPLVAEVSDNPTFITSLYGRLFGDEGIKLINYHNFTIGFREVLTTRNGHELKLQFFRIISAETQLLRSLGFAFLLINVLALVLALVAGYIVSRRTLEPIRTINKAAQELEISDLSRRLALPEVKDELSELMETFNRMLDRLQHGFEQQRRFVSDASHELRTPVTVIRGYSDMLARWGAQDPETLAECVSAIRSETEEMQELIEKLLFLARADQKRQVVKKERVKIDELIAEIAKKTKLVAQGRSVELTQNDEGEAILDAVLFKQMLTVFTENSIKYTEENGKITLSATKNGDKMLVCVKDDGKGISAEHRPHVFERFYRADTSRTKSQGGTGLGLSIAAWIAAEHDIKIELESEEGKGTKITLAVPLVKENTDKSEMMK